MHKPSNAQIGEALLALGLEPTGEAIDQMAVFVTAMQVYEERNVYGEAWKQYGANGNLLSAARKVDRLMEVFWWRPRSEIHKGISDDAVDLLNYAAFFLRLLAQGNLRGTLPMRPRVGDISHDPLGDTNG